MKNKSVYATVGTCILALLLALPSGCAEPETTIAENMVIGPIISTQWHQRNQSAGDYAKYAPIEPGSDGDNWRLGCWSIALAQIFYYYRLEPHGSSSYDTSPGCAPRGAVCHISEDFDSYDFAWDLFVNYFDSSTNAAQENEVAKYAYYTAVAVQKDFGTFHYVGNPQTNFLDNFDCTVQVYYLDEDADGDDYTSEELKDIVINEIKSGYPVMLYITNPAEGKAHAVVADGLWGASYVHVNMGWGPGDCYDHPCNTFYSWGAFGDYDTISRVLTIRPKPPIAVLDTEKLMETMPPIGPDECVQFKPVIQAGRDWTAEVIRASDIQISSVYPDFWNTEYAEAILPRTAQR